MNLDSAFRIANRNQIQAATGHLDKSLIILAAPGSGKTLTLVLRISFLLNMNVNPKQIFVATFTKKAAFEMKKRLSATLPSHINIDDLTLGTFHHCALNILRANAGKAGISWDFNIISSSKQKSILQEILIEFLKQNKFEVLVDHNIKPLSEEQLQYIVEDSNFDDQKKTSFQLPREILSYVYNLICSAKINRNCLKSLNRKFFEVFDLYNRKLRENKSIDLADILFLTNNMLIKHEELLKSYQNKYKYIVIDEFQDTNQMQLEFINLIGKYSCVTVCGDDDQAIYGWRGASNEIFKEFREMFPKAETIVLSQNYRSTQNIVAISQNLISKNSARDFKDIFSKEDVGSLPEVIVAENSRQEAIIIAKIIKNLVLEKFEYRDIAVLYRLHKIAYQVIVEFENFGIPVRSKSKQVSFEKNEIGVISYLRVILDSDDEEAFMSIFNWPKRGLGDSSKLRLKHTASLKNLSLFASLEYLTHNNTGKGNKGFTELYSLLNYFKQNLNSLSPKEIIVSLESKYNLGELPHLIQLSESFTETGKKALELFLQSVNCNQDPNVVTFSSIHQAKGQEWNIVFLIRVNEGVLPAGEDIEEERRLAYVAATRAKKHLIITCSMTGFTGECMIPSRFLDEFFEENRKLKNIKSPASKHLKIVYA